VPPHWYCQQGQQPLQQPFLHLLLVLVLLLVVVEVEEGQHPGLTAVGGQWVVLGPAGYDHHLLPWS
jgi:hypothetical protein